MRTFFQYVMVIAAMMMLPFAVSAQQVSNANFEDWSGPAFDGAAQPKGWNASNVEQVGLKFNFAHKETGHNGGYCMMVQDQSVGLGSISETSPGYFSLGQPWAYLPSVTQINKATAGTYGGITWTHRPDTMSVWIRRTGNDWTKEDFYLLYYSWAGTAIGELYKNKEKGCTSVTYTNEESDIRLAVNGNECGTKQKATQVAEGYWRERAQYSEWTNIRVPIFYMNNTDPTMMNIIFSASNYPNFRANDGLYVGNSLYVDDVEMIYASTIQKLYVGGKEWKAFDSSSKDVQVYSLSESATAIPAIAAYRGAGTITNTKGQVTNFAGRQLTGSEISIVNGDLDKTPTVITVKSADNKSTTVYKIQFQKAASSNAKLASISVNGTPITGFSPSKYNYSIDLPYGTTAIPVVSAEGQEDGQTINIMQPASVNGSATIVVTAPDKTTKLTYNLTFKVGLLSDNTLQDILVNGKSIPGFTPTQTVYKVSLPVGTTLMPTIKAVSAYPDGEQTIVYTAPATIDGGQYQISVTTPGNNVPKVYKLNFKLEASSYTYLADLKVQGNQISKVSPAKPNDQTAIAFTPDNMTYYISLKMGTTELPQILYTRGDEYQTVEVSSLGEGVVDGTVRVTVTAGNGDQSVYKLNFSTEKSEISTLKGIEIDGQPLAGFSPDITSYTYQLPIGTTQLPEIKPIPYDEFQTIVVTTAGVNGTTRITVTAGNGSTTIYQIAFSVEAYTNNTLKALYVGGKLIDGFQPEKEEYWYNLPQGTTALPAVTYELQNTEFQTVSVRSISGLTGDYKITVRPQSGASRTYVIHFTLAMSSNTSLKMIYIDGTPLAGFAPDKTEYEYHLPEGVSLIPTVMFDKAESSQLVLSVLENRVQTITVTAESGAKRVYTIRFIVTVSQNAFLDMIYLDGVPLDGFEREVLNYTSILPGATCPAITVDKAPGQQVTITAPYAAGTAYIKVKPEEGEANTYIIEFEEIAAVTVRLNGILINGERIAEFEPTVMHYERTYEKELPEVGYIKGEESQTVQVLWKDKVAWLHVADAEGNKAAYNVAFTQHLSGNNALKAIYANGTKISGFDANKHDYSYELQPGSSYPEISYEVADNAQVAFFGQTAEGQWQIIVNAEDGTSATYTVTYTIKPYDDATLASMTVDGYTIDFKPNTFVYNLSIDEGAALPAVHVTTKPGQTILQQNVSETEQQVIVTAESGRKNTYKIIYERIKSNNALLADILIDGESIDGFDPAEHNYSYSIPWRSTIVPNVFPVGQLPNQTITTHFCRPNGTVLIHVEAQDGTPADYFVEFPVQKSGNNKLKELELISEYEDVYLEFDPDVTEYVITLPYGATQCPALSFAKDEPEQRIDLNSRPIGQKTEVIVVAENGSKRTYSILFQREVLKTKNILEAIRILETGQEITNLKEQRTFDVEIPYGTRTMTVECEKAYNEQTIFIQPGGVHHPTVITVQANNGDVADVVYTINPIMPTADPAVLTDIAINGVTIEGFTPEQFSYIVPVSGNPIIRYTVNKGADINILVQTPKHWQAEVTFGDRKNTYNVWYYYQNEQVPNTDFSEWSPCATYTSAQKPTGWYTIPDILGRHAGFFWFDPDDLCKKNGSMVELSTVYSVPGGGLIPGFITLGTVTGAWGIAGGSDFDVSGGISFHNSPDVMSVRYKLANVRTSNQIQYVLTGSKGSKTLEWNQTTAVNDFQTFQFDLTDANEAVGDPAVLNILLNSYYQTDGTEDASLSLAGSPKMTVDWISFSYNHTLTALRVDEFDADMSDKAFSVTLTDPERIELPVLAFTGVVEDQAQEVAWDADETIDGEYAVRHADIRNWAENGADYTDYTLTVRRPLDQRNELANLLIDNATIAGFGSKTTFECHLPATANRLPDVLPVPASSLQTVTTNFNKNTKTLTITVIPEFGEPTVYTVRFIVDLSDDTTLANIVAEGLNNYNPATRTYEVAADFMPVINFTKRSDLQLASLVNGVISVTSESGKKGTYTIKRVDPAQTTSGQITQFVVDMPVEGFGGTQKNIEADKPDGAVLFTREFDRDSVVFIQRETQMEWEVYGTVNNTYVWSYPQDLSANNNLADITIDGVSLEGFNASTLKYTVTSEESVVVGAVEADERQTITTTTKDIQGGVEYTIVVKAENGSQKTYIVNVIRPLSNNAQLAGILLDEEMVEGFKPNTTEYTVILPLPKDGVKRVQPKMPNITYLVGQQGQQVTVDPGQLNGDLTYFTVKSEDGTATEYYSLAVNAEKSHCVDLTGITVNGKSMDHFEKGRHYYSTSLKTSDITIDFTSDDRFQHQWIEEQVIKPEQEYIYTIHVTAEDGIEKSDYQIEIYVENKLNDAQLANITLNGKDFVDFERALNEDLTFDGGNNNYLINLPSGTAILPEVNAQLKMEGQQVRIEHHDVDSILLIVTAVDGVTTNTYTLHFDIPLSKNADLSMIFLNGTPLEGFDPTYYFYQVDLEVGVHELPEVVAQKGEASQTIESITVDKETQQATIVVRPEDPKARETTYIIVFHYTQSDADMLSMIYEDGAKLPGFTPTTFYYNRSLPVGTTTFPDLSWDVVDDWQTVTMNTVSESASSLVRQIVVKAESGKKNTYTVAYYVEESSIDTLQMIFVNRKQLPGFKADVYDYNYQLTIEEAKEFGNTLIPVEYNAGDPYQTVTVDYEEETATGKMLAYKTIVTATAPTGASRRYTIHYPIELSDEATLQMIYLSGSELSSFDPERFNYRNEIGQDDAIPVVTATKKEESQNVDIMVEDNNVRVVVTAEDGIASHTYVLAFERLKSAVTTLRDIVLIQENGKVMPSSEFPFRPDYYEYTVNLRGEQLPEIEVVQYLDDQTVEINRNTLPNEDIRVDVVVTAPNGEDQAIYSITFHFLRSDNSLLLSIAIDGKQLEGFEPLNTEYDYNHPYGSTTEDYFDLNDVTYVLSDPQAKVTDMRIESNGTLFITVVAQDGVSETTYIVRQLINKDDDNYLETIELDGIEIRDFDPEVNFYTYYLMEGFNPPGVAAVPHSENAEVSIGIAAAGDTCEIICTAQNGEERIYRVYFAISGINDALAPTPNDVIIKRVPGANQLFIASIRKNVAFALYDQAGRLVHYVNTVPTVDPNDAQVYADMFDKDVLNNVFGFQSGLIINIIPGQLYFYGFYSSDVKFKSGKIIAIPAK